MNVLSADQLTVGYDTPVVRDVTLELSAGEILAVCGPNAAGKSTLLAGLLGLVRPSTGTVQWHDKPLRRWKRRELAKHVALLPQRPAASAAETVADVLLAGRSPHWTAFGTEPRDAVEIARRIADTLDLSDLLDRRLDTLSGGQRQRAFIGRALVQVDGAQSPTIALDEPDAALDVTQTKRLLHLLRTIAASGTAVLVVTHDLQLAAAADRVALVANQRVETGTPADVMTADRLSNAYGGGIERVETGGRVFFVGT
ncbi:MAG: ABC transporter ATP-binding protein [Planctomycetota bacterium]